MDTHPEETVYLHGTSAEEQDRLSRMNRWLNERSLEVLAPAPGMRVLDIGSGMGQMAAEIASKGCTVLGIERSAEQLGRARELHPNSAATFRLGDATALPLEDEEAGTFDLVYARFVLEHVSDPSAVADEMHRAVKPGGRVVLIDDDHDRMKFTPECEPLDRLWAAMIEGYRANGNDPDVGRKLVTVLHRAGLSPTDNGILFFGSCAGSPCWDTAWRNMSDVIASSQETILAHGLLDPAELADGLAVAEEWSKQPDAAVWYGACWAEGIRPT